MSVRLTFAVRDWYAWPPGHHVAAMSGGDAIAKHDRAIELPMMMRRRLTSSGQVLMKAALSCASNRQDVRYVLATRDGELSRTLNILAAVADKELPSPADFSVSVHHALLGLLSIHTKNKAGHTAVSAGPDSFGYGLLEAACCIAQGTGEPVLLLYCDEPLPGPYAIFEDADAARQTQIVALLLDRPTSADDGLALGLAAVRSGAVRTPCLAQSFLAFLASREMNQTAIGADMTWEWSRAA